MEAPGSGGAASSGAATPLGTDQNRSIDGSTSGGGGPLQPQQQQVENNDVVFYMDEPKAGGYLPNILLKFQYLYVV